MSQLLHNPVFNALTSGDQHFSLGTDKVKFFPEQVSPFAGFETGYEKGFEDLYELLSPGRRILYAIPASITEPKGWKFAAIVDGLQFVYKGNGEFPPLKIQPVSLHTLHVEEMVALAKLTKPGPFDMRTIEFGYYHGIFENGRLAAMTGQRLHLDEYTEVSAVCTHPDFIGKGYAAALTQHQAQLILSQGKTPFLHVRADNARAIEIYKRLGFEISREMKFYFMKRL